MMKTATIVIQAFLCALSAPLVAGCRPPADGGNVSLEEDETKSVLQIYESCGSNIVDKIIWAASIDIAMEAYGNVVRHFSERCESEAIWETDVLGTKYKRDGYRIRDQQDFARAMKDEIEHGQVSRVKRYAFRARDAIDKAREIDRLRKSPGKPKKGEFDIPMLEESLDWGLYSYYSDLRRKSIDRFLPIYLDASAEFMIPELIDDFEKRMNRKVDPAYGITFASCVRVLHRRIAELATLPPGKRAWEMPDTSTLIAVGRDRATARTFHSREEAAKLLPYTLLAEDANLLLEYLSGKDENLAPPEEAMLKDLIGNYLEKHMVLPQKRQNGDSGHGE